MKPNLQHTPDGDWIHKSIRSRILHLRAVYLRKEAEDFMEATNWLSAKKKSLLRDHVLSEATINKIWQEIFKNLP